MTRFEELFDFPAGTMRKATRARLKVGTAELRVEVQAEGRSIALNRLPKANRPDSEAAMQREFERGNIQGSRPSLHITVARFRYREALVGWLRAGYLVAFAALGYRYILRPDLDLVRRQIANPRDHVVTVYRATLPAELPEQRRVLLVDEPRALSSLAIQMGRHLIFLPWAPPAQQFYDVLAARAGQLATETLEGQSIPWPHRLSTCSTSWTRKRLKANIRWASASVQVPRAPAVRTVGLIKSQDGFEGRRLIPDFFVIQTAKITKRI